MKKTGFTLAEVLITLGIIGVVAALTAPALVMNSRNEANAARLSVIVSNLENAFSNSIVQENVDSIFDTRMWAAAEDQAFIGELGRYLNVSGTVIDGNFYQDTPIYPMNNNGAPNKAAAANDLPTAGTTPVLLKNGGVVHILKAAAPAEEPDEEAAIARGTNYVSKAADIYIDVNGTASPNTYGRDIFYFQLSDKGILYPYGGKDVELQSGVADGCPGTNGLGCTAQLIDDGYKMNY